MHSTSLESAIYYEKKSGDIGQIELRQHLDLKRNYLIVKRIFDIMVSLVVGMAIFPWFFPILILLIRLDSRGPIFFTQRRVGFLGKTFLCYKFRTMNVNDAADTRQAIRNDPRVTRIGRILRNTGLDELPQFINVFLGHMSLVDSQTAYAAGLAGICRSGDQLPVPQSGEAGYHRYIPGKGLPGPCQYISKHLSSLPVGRLLCPQCQFLA